MAEQLGVGVAIACTSGSAPLNYAPAVVEAYYRQIPLFVLTADRPAHLIDQGDGQCMRQENVYANYIKKSYTYPENLDLQLTDQVAKQAISSLLNEPKGPVHLNIPLSEPLYETEEFNEDLSLKINRFDDTDLSKEDENEVVDIWKNTAKKLVIVGQMEPNKGVQEMLSLLAGDPSVAILVENTSNVQHFAKFCHSIDRTLALISENEIDTFKPDLIVSMGGAIISKKIKAFFRTHPPKHNWRVGRFLIDADTFQSKTKSLMVRPEVFLNAINHLDYAPDSNYGNLWKAKDFIAYDKHQLYISQAPFSDLTVFDLLIDTLPENSSLQMANSSVVRYCQLFNPIRTVTYFSNRGVSGIDGSSSTALGMAVANPDRLVVLITGDISFFYDSNALWNAYLPANFRIFLINNNGGGIFNIIKGPKDSKNNQTFVAPHQAKAKDLCAAFDVEYTMADSLESIESQLGDFYQFDSDKTKLMEINTSSVENGKVLADYFSYISS